MIPNRFRSPVSSLHPNLPFPSLLVCILTAITASTLAPRTASAHICWGYSGNSATNPQGWHTANLESGCSSTNSLHAAGSTTQTIGEEHRNFHCINNEAFTEAYGRRFIAFHRQFINDFDNWRLQNTSYGRLEIWDPYDNAVVPGDNEDTVSAFTNCSDADSPNPGDNIRPAGAVCTGCQNLPTQFIGSNLNVFTSIGDLGRNLEFAWHGSYHNGVQALGCDDIGGFIYTSRDPAFWMAHKKLDEVVTDWQALQATDVVIVIDRSGSMDDNCSSTSPPPSETPCAINDAREAARTFANLVLDVRLDSGSPAAQQHRIGLVSFSSGSSLELGLTSAVDIVTDNMMDDTGFEIALSGITTGGATSIAAGIREAIDMLTTVADPNPHQAILVLTDGKENTVPCLGGNSASSCTPVLPGDSLAESEVGEIQIVSIGFGNGAQEANLRDVAERSGGIFVAEDDVNDPIGLQKFFVTAFGEIFDAGTVSDPRGVMVAGQTESEPFDIDVCGADERISVVMGRAGTRQGSECDMVIELYTPSGRLVDRLGPGVEAGHGERHDFVHVDLPYEGEHEGVWTGRIVRIQTANCEDEEYFYSVLARGLGRVRPFIVRPDVVVGRPLLATFRLSESNRPRGDWDNVNAIVEVSRADGGTQVFQLFDDGTNGDAVAGNNIWSARVPQPPTEPGIYHFRGKFSLEKNGCVRYREAEYSVVVEQQPLRCSTGLTTGAPTAYLPLRAQPGDLLQLDEFFCVFSRCPEGDRYQIDIADEKGWLRTLDPNTGGLIPAPSAFLSGPIIPFSNICFGLGPQQGNPGGGIPLLAEIPPFAQPGEVSQVSIRITPLLSQEEPIDLTTEIRVYPPPDCNNNGVSDLEELAAGTVSDDDRDGIPDTCEAGGHYHTGVRDDGPTRETALRMLSVAPNPFNPRTTLTYEVPAPGASVRLAIYDLSGRLVRVLVDRAQSGGTVSVVWDGRDDQGRAVASGVYAYVLEGAGERVGGKMALLR